jgi:hypothetical protein
MMMKKIAVLFCLTVYTITTSHAQISELQNKEIDSSITYKNGEGVTLNLGKGGAHKINLFATVQSGFQFSNIDSGSKSSKSNRMSLNLARVNLSFTTLKDKVQMGIITDFTSTTPILEGWVGFNFWNKKAKLLIGQRQTHTNNRLAMADERFSQVMGQTTAGKSIDGSVFGGLMQNFIGSTREGALFLETNFNLSKWKIYPSVSITTGEGQNFFDPTPNIGLKYGGRLDILPLGDFVKNNAFIAHDIYREQKPKLAFGAAASFNAKASSPIGSDNTTLVPIYNRSGVLTYADFTKIVADMMFKYKGFSFVAEYVNTSVTGQDLYTNTAGTRKLTTDTSSAYYNIGSAFNIQSSYIFKNGLALDCRITTVQPEITATTSRVQKQTWYGFGVNKYIKNNAIKVGMNVNYIEDNRILLPTKKWIANVAVQIIM